ncbi:unnamed protein product [Diabrotica balteata]|uniref:Uncharacterized protein n=1 Tax=Diabrotica balteata TaxID=107213 RepID=A0A9N9TAC4_DIABA|nr:unnamed protein product [Diabrotica balteata]
MKADLFFNELKEKTTLCKHSDEVEVLTFDFQQNLPLPKIPTGEAFFKCSSWTYNFCVHFERAMPRKRKGADLSRNTSRSRSMRDTRSQRTEEQVRQQNADARVSLQQLRQEQSEDKRAERNEVIRVEQQKSRRFTVNRRRTNDQQPQQVHCAFTSDLFLRLAFQYEPGIKYYAHSKVVIGAMDKECLHCHALKFKNEPPGMSCASGKVQLPEIETPPEPLNGLLIGTDPDSNVFLKSIRTFNSCFQMTSFGATEIVRNTNANGLTIQLYIQNQRPSLL